MDEGCSCPFYARGQDWQPYGTDGAGKRWLTLAAEEKTMPEKRVYYWVDGLKDGTVCLAFVTNKPRKCNALPRQRIDEDGICRWYFTDPEEARRFTEWGKSVWHSSIATCLNMRRVVREQVEARLQRLEDSLSKVQEQLGRIEIKIDRLMSS